MSDTRRQKYYKRCQEIIDDLHERVSNGGFVSDSECIERYGKADYRAFVHELHLMNVAPDWRKMTNALEWMYHSQYFRNKAKEEEATKWQHRSVYCSALAAVLSACCSLVLCCKGCYDAKHTDTHEAQTPYNEYEIENPIAEVEEVGPTDEVLNVIPQIQDTLNHQNRHTKDSAAEKGRKDEGQ